MGGSRCSHVSIGSGLSTSGSGCPCPSGNLRVDVFFIGEGKCKFTPHQAPGGLLLKSWLGANWFPKCLGCVKHWRFIFFQAKEASDFLNFGTQKRCSRPPLTINWWKPLWDSSPRGMLCCWHLWCCQDGSGGEFRGWNWSTGIPSGKHLHNYGKSHFLMGKSTISVHFRSVFNDQRVPQSFNGKITRNWVDAKKSSCDADRGLSRHPTNRKWVSSPWWFQWDRWGPCPFITRVNQPTYDPWDEPLSIPSYSQTYQFWFGKSSFLAA